MDIIIPAQCSIKAHLNSGHVYSRVCTVFSSLIIKWCMYLSLIWTCSRVSNHVFCSAVHHHKDEMTLCRKFDQLWTFSGKPEVWNELIWSWCTDADSSTRRQCRPVSHCWYQNHCWWLTVLVWFNLDGRATGNADIKESWRWVRVILYSLIEYRIYQE